MWASTVGIGARAGNVSRMTGMPISLTTAPPGKRMNASFLRGYSGTGGAQSPNIFRLLAYAQLGGQEEEEVATILQQDPQLNTQAQLINRLMSMEPAL
jgi:hypothetical protein